MKAPLLAVLIPVAFLIAQLFFRDGWFELALGQFALVFWIGLIAWAILLSLSLRRRQWWALLGAPLALYPFALSAQFFVACARGNCL